MSSQSDLLERALRHAAAYLDAIRDRRVAATATGDQMRAAMLQPMPDDGVPAEQVLDDLAALAATGTAATQGPRYFGFVIGGSLPVATATDWLVSAWDQNAGVVLNQVLVSRRSRPTRRRRRDARYDRARATTPVGTGRR